VCIKSSRWFSIPFFVGDDMKHNMWWNDYLWWIAVKQSSNLNRFKAYLHKPTDGGMSCDTTNKNRTNPIFVIRHLTYVRSNKFTNICLNGYVSTYCIYYTFSFVSYFCMPSLYVTTSRRTILLSIEALTLKCVPNTHAIFTLPVTMEGKPVGWASHIFCSKYTDRKWRNKQMERD
jgi:hypothetical protein